MRRVVKLLASQLRRVYFRLARPLLHRMREERAHEYLQHRLQIQQELGAACAAVGAEATRLARLRQELLEQSQAERRALREEVRAELERMNHEFVDYHGALTQKVADELTKMNRRLEPPARAA